MCIFIRKNRPSTIKGNSVNNSMRFFKCTIRMMKLFSVIIIHLNKHFVPTVTNIIVLLKVFKAKQCVELFILIIEWPCYQRLTIALKVVVLGHICFLGR